MENSAWQLISSTQYALPVGVVLILAFLVFALGFKSSVEPPTLALLEEERKTVTKKPRKQKPKDEEKPVDKREKPLDKKEKEKKVVEKKATAEKIEKKDKPAVDNKTAQKTDKKPAAKLVEELKNRKNERNLKKLRQPDEKPVDFDDGNWVQATSRKDKKKVKKEDEQTLSPGKAKRRAEKEAKRLAAELQAKALKEEENNQQQAALQAKQKQESAPAVIEEEPEIEREISKKRNRKGSNTNKKTEELIIEVEKQPGPVANDKKSENVEKVDSNVAFDEMADMWKEAKQPKKSKKKVRKD